MRKIPFILTLFFVLFCSACNMDIAAAKLSYETMSEMRMDNED